MQRQSPHRRGVPRSRRNPSLCVRDVGYSWPRRSGRRARPTRPELHVGTWPARPRPEYLHLPPRPRRLHPGGVLEHGANRYRRRLGRPGLDRRAQVRHPLGPAPAGRLRRDPGPATPNRRTRPVSSDEAETMYDVIIVGAGPVGSTAALLADRQGLRALLVDTSPEVYPEPRAIHFDADVMRIFQFAGIANELESQVRATAGALHLGADGEPIRDFRVTAVDGDLGWKPHYMFYQPQVDALLRRRAADAVHVSAQFGWRCEHIMQHADHVSIELRSDLGAIRHEQAKYLIAADGASSTIRKSFGVNLSDYGFEEPWIIVDGHVENEQLGPDYSIMYCDPSRPATYVPGPRGHRRWEFMLLPGEDGAAYTSPEGAWSLIGGITPWLQESEISFERAAIYKFHALVADRWRTGRVFLAGDAAHQTPPFYGQGMCHGIRDVRNVLWKIAAVITHNADDALLDTYQIEREPHVRS